jgi:ribonuclease T2
MNIKHIGWIMLLLVLLSTTGCAEIIELGTDYLEAELDAAQATLEADTAPPASASTPTTPALTPTQPPAADFDFYVLALSWSPDYCATTGNDDPQQCQVGKKLGFVLHGLWPQYERGYPSNCSTQPLPAKLKTQFPNLYPSAKLYDHEWEKHGTCSGLSPQAYLALSQQIKESVIIPTPYRAPAQPVRVTLAKFKQQFTAANPTMDTNSLVVHCSGSGRFLKEVWVCFTLTGQPRACSKEILADAKSCAQDTFLVRNIR